MRCELVAHQYRWSDKLHSLVYPQPEDYEKPEPYYNEIIALVEYFTDSTVGELKKRFDALETADKRRSFSESLAMFTHNAVDEEVYI